MNSVESIVELLECLITNQPLKWGQDGLQSEAGPKYHSISGVPWLFRDSTSQWIQWKSRCEQLISTLKDEKQRYEKAQINKHVSLLNQRRGAVSRGLQVNIETLNHLLQDFLKSNSFSVPQNFALTDRVASTQEAHSYFDNIFRDWVWGKEENTKSLDLIKKVWPESIKEPNVAVLGAGAGRLGVDIHRHLKPKNTILVDINPVLLLTAEHLLTKGPLDLCEFPKTPVSIEQSAVLHRLESDERKGNNIHFVFADVMNLPFKAKSLDVVVTPWLVDIIPDDYRDFSARMNRVLKPGGVWIQFGPLGFAHKDFSKNYSVDEVLKIVGDQGFNLTTSIQERIPYLQSPHSGFWRVENVLIFAAEKKSDVKQPKRFESLPEWLLDFNKPILLTIELQELRFTNQVHAEILGAVDGKRTFNEMVQLMAKHYQMSSDQATDALFTLLARIHESKL
ncbi:MAG: class I SAM-dependent methyltransferase [Pseudobdellovibrionaceae bacterium]|nr:MAG: class I SAM-dependent methyltransferase [Pseudobdellovibrionaceae bacterium]